MPILVILNCLALIILVLAWQKMPQKLRRIFLFACGLSLLLLGLITVIHLDATELGMFGLLLFFLRGGLLFALLFGAFSCYIAYRFFHTK